MPVAPLLSGNLVDWTHKRQEPTRNNPVEIAILHFLIVFVFFDVEGVVVVPAVPYREFQPLNTVLHGALVKAFALAGITVASQIISVRFKRVHRFS